MPFSIEMSLCVEGEIKIQLSPVKMYLSAYNFFHKKNVWDVLSVAQCKSCFSFSHAWHVVLLCGFLSSDGMSASNQSRLFVSQVTSVLHKCSTPSKKLQLTI